MADPVTNILAPEPAPAALDQDDPANYERWAQHHEKEAERIAAQEPADTESERVGQLLGEMDHRSAAAGFRESIANQERSRSYADEVRRAVAERVVAEQPPSPSNRRQEAIEDTLHAFRDYGIPEDLVEHAVLSGNLANQDAGEREAFVIKVLDTKRSLDVLAAGDGPDVEVDGINDWKSAIDATAANLGVRADTLSGEDKKMVERLKESLRQQRESKTEAATGDPNRSSWRDIIRRSSQRADASLAKAGLASASTHWAQSTSQLREKYPLLASNQEAEKVARAGARRAWLVDKIPDGLQRRLGLSSERTYNNGVENAYQKLIDKKSDALLKDRSKALVALRDVDPKTPPHLLPSKQYRAAENLTRIDQELRTLRPLHSQEYGAAIQTAKGGDTRDQARQPDVSKAPAKSQDTRQDVPVANREPVQAAPTKHDQALAAVRDIRSQTPVDGYRSKAADAMTNRIVQQLQEGRQTVQLSAKYAGGDQGQANATHRNAVEANAQIIESVRQSGVAVDTGTASVIPGKKLEVESGQQAGVDQSIESLL